MTTPTICFIDTETTGLDPRVHTAWEYAIIRREPGQPDTEHVLCVEPDLTTADPMALEINRYHERTSARHWAWDEPRFVACRLTALLDGATMVGSNPGFDAGMISALLTRHGLHPQPWHYRTVDIATLAAGYQHGRSAAGIRHADVGFATDQPQPPYRSYEMSRAVGVEPPTPDVAHTALGDARWARDVYDAVTGGNADTTPLATHRGDFTVCAHAGCPQGEWSGLAVQRGWRQAADGQVVCPQHAGGDR